MLLKPSLVVIQDLAMKVMKLCVDFQLEGICSVQRQFYGLRKSEDPKYRHSKGSDAMKIFTGVNDFTIETFH